jgi:integrase
MFEDYYKCPRAIARLRAHPFGEQLEAFTSYLSHRGHARLAVRGYMRNAQHFTHWLAARKMPLNRVDERVIRSFVRYEAGHWYQRRVAREAYHVCPGLRQFLEMLRSSGHIPAPSDQPGTIESVVAAYDCYLRDTCGFAPDTRINRTRFAREFLRVTFGARMICWDRLRPKHLRSFVIGFGHTGRIASAVVAASSLRGFLRWLVFQGLCSPSLNSSVPGFHRCKYTSLPRVMTDRQLQLFLAVFDRSTPIGRRDHAMALCQAHLGLRVGEVAALTIDDIDWRNATIRIAESKTRRGRVLPLLPSVGRAIANYLRHGRPDTSCRHLFVRCTFPVGRAVSRGLIIGVYRRAFARVPGCEGWHCSHVLRSTAATRMYSRGATPKTIADLLGHSSLDTTALYTRVDRSGLAAVALPWPKEGKL